MDVLFLGVGIVLSIVGLIELICGGIAWGKGKTQGISSMVRGVFMVAVATMSANGAMDRQLADRVATLEAQLAKQQPAAQNTIEQK